MFSILFLCKTDLNFCDARCRSIDPLFCCAFAFPVMEYEHFLDKKEVKHLKLKKITTRCLIFFFH